MGPQVVDLLLLLGYRGGVEDDQGSKEGSLKAENFFARIVLPCNRVEDVRRRVIMGLVMVVDLLVFMKRGRATGATLYVMNKCMEVTRQIMGKIERDVGRKGEFEDKLEVKAENNRMAETAIISEEETENADNSEKK